MIALFLGVLIVGLGTYRLARAVAVDDISEPVRGWVYDRAYPNVAAVAQVAEHIEIPTEGEPGRRPWTWLYALMSCPFCVGWWIGLALWVCWREVDWSRAVIAAVAVAGVGALCSAFDHRAMR